MLGGRFTDVRRFSSIDSTNRYLLEEARAGAADGVVAVADHQTSGRGRLGRRWEAPAGTNLLASVLLRPELPVDERHLAAAVVCLAGREAAQAVAGVTLGVKWPNDLVSADGRKVAGVLAEADLPEGPGALTDAAALVVGIGMNVNWPSSEADLPDELAGSACSLRQLAGRSVDRTALLAALLAALEPRAGLLASPSGRRRAAADLGAACSTIGCRVRVDLAGESFEGTATGVTREGHLVVDVGDGARTVVAGDVVHLRDAGGRPSPGEGPGAGRCSADGARSAGAGTAAGAASGED